MNPLQLLTCLLTKQKTTTLDSSPHMYSKRTAVDVTFTLPISPHRLSNSLRDVPIFTLITDSRYWTTTERCIMRSDEGCGKERREMVGSGCEIGRTSEYVDNACSGYMYLLLSQFEYYCDIVAI